MKRLLSLFIATLFISATAMSQDIPVNFGAKEKKNAFYIGPKAGVTINTMTQPDEGSLYDGFGIGFSGGLAMKARFGYLPESSDNPQPGILGVGLELKYRQSSVKTFGTDEDGKTNAKLSLGYFDVPVFVQLYPFYKSDAMNTFYVELGASFTGVMSRSPKSLTLVGGPNDNYSSVTYHIDGDNKLKGVDARPFAGIGYTIKSASNNSFSGGLDINARYYLGMSKMADNFACKMSNIEVSLAWMFNVCGF